MFSNFIDKCKALLNQDDKKESLPITTRSSNLQNSRVNQRVRIFDTVENKSYHSRSNSITNPDDLKNILSPRQLTFHFDMDLYVKLNKQPKSADLVERRPISPKLNIHLLKENLTLINNYKMMSERVMATDNKVYKNVNFSPQELKVFSISDELRVISFVFQKYRGLIERKGILEHQNFIENELFEAREYFNSEMIKTRDTYLKQIELSFKRLEELSDSAAFTYIKVKTLRSNLQKLQELQQHKRQMDLKFKKQQGAQKMLIIINKLNYKFPKIVKLLEQSFSIQKAGQAYKMLIVSGLYCIKKLEGGYYLFFIRKLYQRIEDRLMYVKHKLRQNFYYELKQGIEGKQIAMDKVDEMIKQFVQIEKIAFHFYKPTTKDHQGLNTMLEKDTDMFSKYIRELDDKTPQLLESNILRVRLTQLYNHYKSNVNTVN